MIQALFCSLLIITPLAQMQPYRFFKDEEIRNVERNFRREPYQRPPPTPLNQPQPKVEETEDYPLPDETQEEEEEEEKFVLRTHTFVRSVERRPGRTRLILTNGMVFDLPTSTTHFRNNFEVDVFERTNPEGQLEYRIGSDRRLFEAARVYQ